MVRITSTTRGRISQNHEPKNIMNEEGDDPSHTNSRDWLMDNIYYTTHSKPKMDVILLKMNSGYVWFTEASITGTPFKFWS